MYRLLTGWLVFLAPVEAFSLQTSTSGCMTARSFLMNPKSARPVDTNPRSRLGVATEDAITETIEVAEDITSENTTASLDVATVAIENIMPDLIEALETEAEQVAYELVDETCEVEMTTGLPVDDECLDEVKRKGLHNRIKDLVKRSMGAVAAEDEDVDDDELDWVDEEDEPGVFGKVRNWLKKSPSTGMSGTLDGDTLEKGWERRGNTSALKRNAEVWKFALKVVFKTLKSRKLAKKGAPEEAIKAAKLAAATFLRDGLLELGPTFVKLGQVVSTRTDVLPMEFTDTLKSLQDEVPGFSGERAKEIVSKELGRPFDEVFTDFSAAPLKAASLGQVHTAYYTGQKVAIKVQRAGLKELFDVDLKNLKKLAELLDKFDPKSDGADRDWVGIYEESERLLYLEIDYLNEADNAERFAKDFTDTSWVRVPKMYRDLSTPRVLTMEFVESFKLTDGERIDNLGLDRKVIAKHTADAFLRQIVETGYFHCDPHSGNMCCDDEGNLVYYDFGMMDELKPNVRSGFRKFCTALFDGGPTIDDLTLAKNAKKLVDGVEEAGVLARGADRLAVEKLARYFMRTFKDKQLGKTSGNIKSTIGADLQTLTENNVFRFPSTFTFIFRAFASIDGIGKELDTGYDLGKLAQPFLEKFIDMQKGYGSQAEKNLAVFSRATGLNQEDIGTAVSSPRKIAYLEETLREMESGNLKIRVRSLENEKALERMALTQGRMENLVLASLLLNAAGLATRPLFRGAGVLASAFFAFQALMTNVKVKKFDKTQAKYTQTTFEDVVDDESV